MTSENQLAQDIRSDAKTEIEIVENYDSTTVNNYVQMYDLQKEVTFLTKPTHRVGNGIGLTKRKFYLKQLWLMPGKAKYDQCRGILLQCNSRLKHLDSQKRRTTTKRVIYIKNITQPNSWMGDLQAQTLSEAIQGEERNVSLSTIDIDKCV